MASKKQINANRENSAKSTGPSSIAGKEIVRLNAIKHGILSNKVIPGESPQQYQEFVEGLMHEMKPVGNLEICIVNRIASCLWRLQRILKVEDEIFTRKRSSLFQGGKDEGAGFAFFKNADVFAKLGRYETSIERALYRSIAVLKNLQAERRKNP
jgi:hypothetical protein